MHFYRFGRLLSRGGRGCFVSVSGEVVIAVVVGDGATVAAEVAASINFRFFPPPEAFLSVKFEGCEAVVPRAPVVAAAAEQVRVQPLPLRQLRFHRPNHGGRGAFARLQEMKYL